MVRKCIIIGSGPAGLTAAIYAARADLKPLLISGTLPGGLLTQTSEVENFPGFENGVSGFDLMNKMQQQAEKFGTEILYDSVDSVQLLPGGVHTVKCATSGALECEALIIATGASPRWLGLPSEERLKNHGVSACATCDGAFYRNLPVAVVGGGDSAMEEALFLTNFASSVTVIHRRGELRASKIMAERALANPKIRFIWNSAVTEVVGDKVVTGLKLQNLQDNSVSTVDCDGLFVALGHMPNTRLFAKIVEMDEQGYIKTSGSSTATNIPGVFACGDCADRVYRQAITAAGTGGRAGIDAERYLAAK